MFRGEHFPAWTGSRRAANKMSAPNRRYLKGMLKSEQSKDFSGLTAG